MRARVVLRSDCLQPLPVSAFACPGFDLGSDPELASTRSHVHDRSRHIGVSLLVHAHGVPMRDSKHQRDRLGVDQVSGVDASAHRSRLHVLTPVVVTR